MDVSRRTAILYSISKRTLKFAVVLTVLVLIAYTCRITSMFLSQGSVSGLALGLIRSFIYTGIFFAWGVSVSRRIIQKHTKWYMVCLLDTSRDLESDMAQRVAASERVVISCGGGTVLRRKNIDALRSSGSIVLLRAKPETVLERVKKNGDKRPLLSRYQSRGYISWLMKKRSDIYADAADYIINVDGRTADDIACLLYTSAVYGYIIAVHIQYCIYTDISEKENGSVIIHRYFSQGNIT